MTSVRRALTALASLRTLAAIPQLAERQQTCAPRPVARIESVKNTVQFVQASTRAAIPAARDVQVCAGDTIQVGDNSRAVVLMLGSNTPLVIDQNSEFVVTDGLTGGGTVIDLVRGALLFITPEYGGQSKSAHRLSTPQSKALSSWCACRMIAR